MPDTSLNLPVCVHAYTHVYVSVCMISVFSCPVRVVARAGVGGRRDYTAACDVPPHCTAYTEPEKDGQR